MYRGHIHAAIGHQDEAFPQALKQAPLQQDRIIFQYVAIVAQLRTLGKVQGKVKILKSVDEVGKIEQGDILVAVMTLPTASTSGRICALRMTIW